MNITKAEEVLQFKREYLYKFGSRPDIVSRSMIRKYVEAAYEGL